MPDDTYRSPASRAPLAPDPADRRLQNAATLLTRYHHLEREAARTLRFIEHAQNQRHRIGRQLYLLRLELAALVDRPAD